MSIDVNRPFTSFGLLVWSVAFSLFDMASVPPTFAAVLSKSKYSPEEINAGVQREANLYAGKIFSNYFSEC